jgi:radical SAM protein with 4Fe4S-binding SPASM domain
MESNAADLAALAALARALGAESSFDAKITGKETADQAPARLRMSERTLRAFYRDADSGMAEFLAQTYAGFDPADLRPLHHTPCRAGQQSVAINPRGQVWPCNALPIACGSLRERSFEEIWTGSAALADVRGLRWAQLSECNACQLRAYCQRCHGMALLEQGQLRGPSLEACRHAVAVRDALRERGLVPAAETAMPPTWSRVDPDGQHHLRAVHAPDSGAAAPGLRSPRRSGALRVIP